MSQKLKLNLFMFNIKNLDCDLLLDVSNPIEVHHWCKLLNCNEVTLQICIYYSGNSIVSIQSFLSENKELFEKYKFLNLI
jgi:hypothetical protein